MTEKGDSAPPAPDDGAGSDDCIGRRLLFGARSDVLVELVEDAGGVGKVVAGKLVAAGPRSTISAVEAAMEATVDAALGVTSEATDRGRGALDWGRKVVGRQVTPPESGDGAGSPAEQRE